ncbi:MAG: FtsX-like permease family protein [Bacteroidetes bacterium]|nr:FtsX-like permease family protein [Bacteroidota bacterium]
MLTLKLAFKNVTKAGLRTWLNVLILSFAYVLIIWTDGLYDGMSKQVVGDMIDMEIGGGQFWERNYDKFDPFTIDDAYAPIPENLEELVKNNEATPVLFRASVIFPQGRVQSAILKGIDPNQKVLKFPSEYLNTGESDYIPGLIGSRMAKNSGLKNGDIVTVRWQDVNGTFDATDIEIVNVISSYVQTIDNGQIWIPLKSLQEMIGATNVATVIVLHKDIETIPSGSPLWEFKDHNFLLADFYNYLDRKGMGSAIMYGLLMAMALLAIFDTQVLAIFRRRKEMGTMMALGMTRGGVIRLFTLEGTMHGILAIIIGTIYGLPILYFSAVNGIAMPEAVEQVGLSLNSTLYPVYGIGLFLSTSLIMFISVIVVSFLPTRKIARLNPTDALRGKIA